MPVNSVQFQRTAALFNNSVQFRRTAALFDNSVQFRRTVALFNNQKVLKCNMNQLFFSDTTNRQCHITTFRTCSPLVLLYLVLFCVLFFLHDNSEFKF